MVAVGLAERLNVATSYLADLKVQYGDAPGLSMVSEVLSRLVWAAGGPGPARVGTRPRPRLLMCQKTVRFGTVDRG